MLTPLKVVIVGLVIGVGGAILYLMHLPPAPTEQVIQPTPDQQGAPSLTQGPPAPTSRPALALASGAKTVTPSGLTIIEVKDGTGNPCKKGDTVNVHYIGRLYDGGEQFDNSYDRGTPFPVTLGAGQVVKGFEEGLTGMKVGEKREIIIPPDLAYGDAGAGDKIPGGATLVFDLELMSITPGS